MEKHLGIWKVTPAQLREPDGQSVVLDATAD
jgi:hypothetical protein